MAVPSASATVALSGKVGRWPPAWLTNVGVAIGLGLIVLLSSMAIGAAATSMTEHGVSVGDFQFAGTSAKAELAYNELGQNGRRSAWWFLAFELPFLVGYGLLLCAGCAFAARQLAAAGAERLARLARFGVLFGLLAASSDLIQNSALAINLMGHFAQPAPALPRYSVISPGSSASRLGSSSSQGGSSRRSGRGKWRPNKSAARHRSGVIQTRGLLGKEHHDRSRTC